MFYIFSRLVALLQYEINAIKSLSLISGPRPSLWLLHSSKFSCWVSQWLPPPPSSAVLAPFSLPPLPSCDTSSPPSFSSPRRPEWHLMIIATSHKSSVDIRARLTLAFNLFWISREISFLCLHTRFFPFLTLTSCSMLLGSQVTARKVSTQTPTQVTVAMALTPKSG